MKRYLGLSFLIFLFALSLLAVAHPVQAAPIPNGGDDDCPGPTLNCWQVARSECITRNLLPSYADDGWECFGSASACASAYPYCLDPWSKVNFTCKQCEVGTGEPLCYESTWVTSISGTACYSGDVCSSNPGAGWIDAGHGGASGCWYGGVYKRCCSGTQFTGDPKAARCWVQEGVNRSDCNNPSACYTQYGTGYVICSGGTGWDTCRSEPPPPPSAPTCSLTANPSSGTAPLSGTLSWSTTNCSSGSCTCTASGGWSGSKTVPSGSQGYGPISSTTTYNLSCTNAGGTGTCGTTVTVGTPPADPCALPCSPGAWWAGSGDNCGRCGCGAQQSAQCNSAGTAWNCVDNPGLCATYHRECRNGFCQSVEGAGSDQCSSDPQCRHNYCSGTGLSATCKLSLTPGANECTTDPDCQPPACGWIFINGNADYTNTLNVTLSLSAYNADQMRFRNQGLAWSSWESYATVKSWTLSAGADGGRSVTGQYRNERGTSALDPSCTDTIILDGTPPTSSMTPLPAWSTTTPVTLNWSGSDNLAPTSELKYWFQFSNDGGISWIDLPGGGSQVLPTDKTSYDFAGEEGVLYCFRVRARDPAGNWEDWPLTYDTCTRIDLGITMYGFGWTFGDASPDVWVSVFDGVSGINYSALQCWYSSNGGATWTARTCNYAPTDPTTVSMLDVPFASQSGTLNKARFRACDVAGNCLTNTYTVDNRTTGAWVQTFGGDIHGNSNLQLRPAPSP